MLVFSQGFSEIINHLFQTGHIQITKLQNYKKKIVSKKKIRFAEFHSEPHREKPWKFSDRCDFCPILPDFDPDRAAVCTVQRKVTEICPENKNPVEISQKKKSKNV